MGYSLNMTASSGLNLCKLGVFSLLISSVQANEINLVGTSQKEQSASLLSKISDVYSDFIKTHWIYDYQIKFQPGEKWTPQQILNLGERVVFFTPGQIKLWNLTHFEPSELDELRERIMEKWSTSQIHQLNVKDLSEDHLSAIALKRDDYYGYINRTWINSFSSEQLFSVIDRLSLEELSEIESYHLENMDFSNITAPLAKKLRSCCLPRLLENQQKAVDLCCQYGDEV